MWSVACFSERGLKSGEDASGFFCLAMCLFTFSRKLNCRGLVSFFVCVCVCWDSEYFGITVDLHLGFSLYWFSSRCSNLYYFKNCIFSGIYDLLDALYTTRRKII